MFWVSYDNCQEKLSILKIKFKIIKNKYKIVTDLLNFFEPKYPIKDNNVV